MHRLERDGVALRYEEAGVGAPPLLLVHGLACDHTFLAPQFEYFRREYRVVAVDLRGHGQSDKPRQDYTIEGFADDLAWLCGELGLYRPVIIGHGEGGVAALALAAREPLILTAILALDATIVPPPGADAFLAPFTDGIHGPDFRATLLRFMGMLFHPATDPALKDKLLDQINLPQHVLVSAWDHGIAYDTTIAATGCKTPVLYIEGGAPNCDLARFRDLCPQLMTSQTVGAGHFHQLEAPAQVNAMIDRFLVIVAPG